MDFHLDHIKQILKDKGELGKIYENIIIRNFALSMAAIFVPIYLLNLGYEIGTVLAFFLATFLGSALISPIVSKMTSHFGVKHTISVSLPFLLLYIISLSFLGTYELPLVLIAFIGSLANTMYYNPFNTDFIKYSHGEKRGKETGYLFASSKLALATGPLVGALIIHLFGFGALFTFVSILILLSMLTLIKGEDIKPSNEFTWRYVFSEDHKKHFFRFFMQGFMNVGEGIIWPLFVFIFVSSATRSIGLLGALLTFGAVAFSIIVGKMSDKVGKIRLIKTGAILASLLWIIRIYFDLTIFVFASSFIAGMLMTLVDIPLLALAGQRAKKEEKVLEFVTMREIGLNLGRTFLLLIAIALFSLNHSFWAISGAAGLLFLL